MSYGGRLGKNCKLVSKSHISLILIVVSFSIFSLRLTVINKHRERTVEIYQIIIWHIFPQITIWCPWRHQMETFSALLARCEGNPPVPSQRPVMWGCFLWSAPEQTTEQTIDAPLIWDTITLIMTSLQSICFTTFQIPVDFLHRNSGGSGCSEWYRINSSGWVSARKMYIQYVSNGVMSFLH